MTYGCPPRETPPSAPGWVATTWREHGQHRLPVPRPPRSRVFRKSVHQPPCAIMDAMDESTPDPLTLPWRTGRHVGRTIYSQGGAEASRDDDVLIGVMDTAELAAEACEAHNYRLAMRQAPIAMHPAT